MWESFNDCVMFCHLSVFPNNTTEQEKHYLSNVLKKPQRVGVLQFIQYVEQLNPYVVQLPCWYYSPSYNAGMMPANVPFSEADLASQVLWMCPYQWQDQYNPRLCIPSGIPGILQNPQESGFEKKVTMLLFCRNL
jgi:hypothetical protein